MLNNAEVVKNLKRANRVEASAKGFSAEIHRICKLYDDVKYLKYFYHAIPDLPDQYLDELSAWVDAQIAPLKPKLETLQSYASALRSYTYNNSDDENDRIWGEWIGKCDEKELGSFDSAEIDTLMSQGTEYLAENVQEHPELKELL